MTMLAATLIAAMAPTYAFTHVQVLDMDSGKWQRDRTVIVRNGRIEAVAANAKLPAEANKIDGKGKYIIPGLWDAHIHWYDQRFLSLFTANGVTSARVMFGAPMHRTWRENIRSGALIGPNLEIPGPIVDGPKPIWPGSIACGTAEEGKSTVERHKTEKWDFVKVYSLLPRDVYFAIANEAKKQGIRFEGHVPSSVSVTEASNCGQSTIEHMTGMLAESTAPGRGAVAATGQDASNRLQQWRLSTNRSLANFSEDMAKKMAATLKKNGTMICPTLTVLHAMANLTNPDIGNDPRLIYMPATLKNSWNPKTDFRFKDWQTEDWEMAKRRFGFEKKLVGILAQAGVKLLAGTDCLNPYCMPGFSLHDELALLVECGASPIEALRAATIRPAELVGRKDLGRVKPGQTADFVLLNADPLQSIRSTTKIAGVMQAGKWHDRKALDAMLAGAKKLASGGSAGESGSAGYMPCHHDF